MTIERPDWGDERERRITWHDPLLGAGVGRQSSGRDYLQAMLDGVLPPPPITRTLGFALTRIEDGEAWFGCTPDESTYNPIGSVHGGLVCTLLDSALGCAVHTQLPAGVGYTSIEIKINYLRGVNAALRPADRSRLGDQAGSPGGLRRRRPPRRVGSAGRDGDR